MDFDPKIMTMMTQFGEVSAKFDKIAEYISHLEQGLLQTSIESQRSRFVQGAIFNILIEKEIVSAEEMKKILMEKVEEPIQNFVTELNKKIEANAEEIKDRVEEKVNKIITQTSKEEPTEDTSNVVLASERFKK